MILVLTGVELTSDKKGHRVYLTQSHFAGMYSCIQPCDPHIATLAMRLTLYKDIASIADCVYIATKLKVCILQSSTNVNTTLGEVGS